MASEYNYVRPVEEKKSWDKFATTLEAGGSASEQHTDFIKKASVALKLITGFIVFAVVLTAGAVSKGALLFMVAQVYSNKILKFIILNTPTPWLTLLLVLGKSCLKQILL